jgi:hypothetical protein
MAQDHEKDTPRILSATVTSGVVAVVATVLLASLQFARISKFLPPAIVDFIGDGFLKTLLLIVCAVAVSKIIEPVVRFSLDRLTTYLVRRSSIMLFGRTREALRAELKAGTFHPDIHSDNLLRAAPSLRQRKRISVTAAYLKDRWQRSIASAVIAGSALVVLIYVWTTTNELETWSMALVVLIGACPLLDLWVAKFRFERGFYGSNEGEAREIVAYIIENSEKFDPGDGNLKIFEADLERARATAVSGAIPAGQSA